MEFHTHIFLVCAVDHDLKVVFSVTVPDLFKKAYYTLFHFLINKIVSKNADTYAGVKAIFR